MFTPAPPRYPSPEDRADALIDLADRLCAQLCHADRLGLHEQCVTAVRQLRTCASSLRIQPTRPVSPDHVYRSARRLLLRLQRTPDDALIEAYRRLLAWTLPDVFGTETQGGPATPACPVPSVETRDHTTTRRTGAVPAAA